MTDTKTLASFVTAAKALVTAQLSAERKGIETAETAHIAVNDGHAQTILAESTGLSAGSVSKYVAAGAALAVLGTYTEDQALAVIRTAQSQNGKANKAAMSKAVKDGDIEGVLSAANAPKPEAKKKEGTVPSVALDDMEFEALVRFGVDALERAIAKASAPKQADVLVATLIELSGRVEALSISQ